MLFRDIIGQEDIKHHMQTALREDKISHAYIINGEKESGKMTLAMAFVQTLFCEKGGDEPCGECPSCKKVEEKCHPDLLFVSHENPKMIKVQEIRDQVVDQMMYRPYSAKRKVFIIEDAELMNASAQNAVLKSIEEPPSFVTVILLTSNASAMLDTIRSRCIMLNIVPALKEQDQIKKKLMQTYGRAEYEAENILSFAQGNVGKAYELATNEEFTGLIQKVLDLTAKAHRMKQIEIENFAAELKNASKSEEIDLKEYLELLVLWYRDVLLYKATANTEYLFFKDHVREIKKQAQRGSYKNLNDCLDSIEKARKELRSNIDIELIFTVLMQVMKEI